jgi:hypothetical protein
LALNPSAVDGITITLSALSWAVSWVGQDDISHARKAVVSLNPEIKMGVS